MVGLVVCYEPNFRNGTAKVAALGPSHSGGLGAPMGEGLELFADYVFRTFDLRKLHADCLEPNADQFGSAIERLFEVEARFRGQEFVDGSYVDLLVLTLWRERWEEWVQRGGGAADLTAFEDFAREVSLLVGTDPSQLEPGTSLDGLALDSLMLLELIDLVEGDSRLPDDALSSCHTLGDCHHLHLAGLRLPA
jgi:acyl carrier protein